MDIRLLKDAPGLIEVQVEGGISNETNQDFYDKAAEIWGKCPEKDMLMICDKLEYLSSGGIRSLITLDKNFAGNLSLIQLQPEVFDILAVTGINTFITCERIPEPISLEGKEIIGRGGNGIVYRVDEDRIVKMYAAGVPITVPMYELERSRQAFLLGIPTAIAYGTVQEGDRIGGIYELINAVTLSSYISQNPEKFEELAEKYVDLCKQLHTTTVDRSKFPSCKEIYRNYISDVKDWYTEEELEALRRFLDYVPDRNTLIHGDFHPNNVMVVKDELMLIDMGDMSYGHPIFDFLNTASTQANLVDLNPEYAEIHTRMPVEYITKMWNRLLQLYFKDYPDEKIQDIDRLARFMSKFKVALAPVVGKELPKELIEASVNDAKANFIPRIDELANVIDW